MGDVVELTQNPVEALAKKLLKEARAGDYDKCLELCAEICNEIEPEDINEIEFWTKHGAEGPENYICVTTLNEETGYEEELWFKNDPTFS